MNDGIRFICGNCSKIDDLEKSEKFKVCSKCRIKRYCSIECQKENWKEHKLLCKEKGELLGENIYSIPFTVKNPNKKDKINNLNWIKLNYVEISNIIKKQYEKLGKGVLYINISNNININQEIYAYETIYIESGDMKNNKNICLDYRLFDMVEKYDPDKELVICLFEDNLVSSYRLSIIPKT